MNPSQRETRAFVVAHVVLPGIVLIGFALLHTARRPGYPEDPRAQRD